MSAFLALAHDDGWGHMGDWGGGWMWLWGPLMMIGFVVLIFFAMRIGSAPRDPAHRAREILAERYAKGEISTEDYRKRISELQ